MSALEGGYNLKGGLVSAFARSVAAHVRALADGNRHAWDPKDAQVSRKRLLGRASSKRGLSSSDCLD